MSFNIGNQFGGSINNVAGNQHIHGGQHAHTVTVDTARHALLQLRDAAAGLEPNLGMNRETTDNLKDHLDTIEAELTTDHPNRTRAGQALEKATAILSSTGALAAAGATLISPIQAIATWAGTWGPSIAQLLTRLG